MASKNRGLYRFLCRSQVLIIMVPRNSISAQNGYLYSNTSIMNEITTRLLIISCNTVMLTVTTALYAGSVYHV